MDAATFISTASDLPLFRTVACALYAGVFGLAWAAGCRKLYPALRRRTPSLRKDDYAKLCVSFGVAASACGVALVGDGSVVAAAFSMPDKGSVCAAGADLVADGGKPSDDLMGAYNAVGCGPEPLQGAYRAAQAKRDAAERAEAKKIEEAMWDKATNIVATIGRQGGGGADGVQVGGGASSASAGGSLADAAAEASKNSVETVGIEVDVLDADSTVRLPLELSAGGAEAFEQVGPLPEVVSMLAAAGGRVAAHLNVASVGGRAASLRVSKPDNAPVVKGTLRPFSVDDALEIEYDLSFFPGGGAAVHRLGHMRMGAGTASMLRVDAEDGQGTQWLVLTARGSVAAPRS